MLAELNIPLSSVNNRQAREQYQRIKMDVMGEEGDKTPSRHRKKKKQMILSPRWTAIDREGLEEEGDKTPLPRQLRKKKKMILSPRWTAID